MAWLETLALTRSLTLLLCVAVRLCLLSALSHGQSREWQESSPCLIMGVGRSKNTNRNFQKLSCHDLLGPGKPSGAHLLGVLSLLHSVHLSILLSLIDGVPSN